MRFIGRRKELEDLNVLLKKKSASLVVIRGRRRIGKSRLIQEFTKDKKNWIFSGLAPVKGMTKQRQIDAFANQVVDEVEEKMKRLSIPYGYSIRPVLIHVNGVSQSVKESSFFTQIIDFSDFFKT